jgi:hypothetical protein
MCESPHLSGGTAGGSSESPLVPVTPHTCDVEGPVNLPHPHNLYSNVGLSAML